MTRHISKGLYAAAFLVLAIAIPAGGCRHPSSAAPDATTASYEELRTLIGKQVTIRGKFSLWGKFGPFVQLGTRQAVYLVPRGSFTWGEPYTEMDGKFVAATGILSFSHSPAAESADPAVARPPDYFYFQAETAQLRLITR